MRHRLSGLPRTAHCIGCGLTYSKMHLMINHRRLDRCGGRFLPEDERELVDAAKIHWQKFNTTPVNDITNNDLIRWHYHQYKDMLSRFFLLRKRRLDASAHP